MKLPKYLALIIVIILLCGCQVIEKASYDNLISNVVTSKYDLKNTYRTGYNFYLPNGIKSSEINEYNEILTDSKYNYYLYVDVVSFYNRVIEEYEKDDTAFYSQKINYADKFGYLEVNKLENDKYLIEIMYNYAKIEVIVHSYDLNDAITKSLIVLASINYNNEILANVVGDDSLQFDEEKFDIFSTKKKDITNILDVGSSEIEDNKDEGFNDPDLIERNN